MIEAIELWKKFALEQQADKEMLFDLLTKNYEKTAKEILIIYLTKKGFY